MVFYNKKLGVGLVALLCICNLLYLILYLTPAFGYKRNIVWNPFQDSIRPNKKFSYQRKLRNDIFKKDTSTTTESTTTYSKPSRSSSLFTTAPFSTWTLSSRLHSTEALSSLLTTFDQPGCRVKTDWDKYLPNPTVITNLKDWGFSKTSKCYYSSILDTSRQRDNVTFSFNCSNDCANNVCTSNEKVNGTKTNLDIKVVGFGDRCLLSFIENCCYDNNRVPNVVHYVMYQKKELKFFEFVSLYSVIRFVRPCAILMHGDELPSGTYWFFIRKIYPNIIHVQRSPPMYIGHQLRGFPEHSGDIMRIEALLQYGGIYLDLDTVIVRPIDNLRESPYTMSAQSSGYISSAFIASERNSTFLYYWYLGYKQHYRPYDYIYNAMLYPKRLALIMESEINVLRGTLSRPWYQIGSVVYKANYNWTSIYGMHLFSRIYPRVMTEERIKLFNSTVGSICRHILFGNKDLCFG